MKKKSRMRGWDNNFAKQKPLSQEYIEQFNGKYHNYLYMDNIPSYPQDNTRLKIIFWKGYYPFEIVRNEDTCPTENVWCFHGRFDENCKEFDDVIDAVKYGMDLCEELIEKNYKQEKENIKFIRGGI